MRDIILFMLYEMNMDLHVKVYKDVLQCPRLIFGAYSCACAIGQSGVIHHKIEGDGFTPLGTWKLREMWYRDDRLRCPETLLPTYEITRNLGWSDDPEDSNYNSLVHLPYRFHCEKLWREDALYDIFIPLGYNDKMSIAGRGSAIFLHLSTDDYQPTKGCIAISLEDMRLILPHLHQETVIVIDSED